MTNPVPRFADLSLREEVLRALREISYDEPTPVQIASLAPIIEGRDLMVQAQTGTGKTAAFGIPLADRLVSSRPGVQALILEPTRELALQVSEELARIARHTGIRVAAVYGGASMSRQVTEIRQGAQIVAGTPGRVLDHLRRGNLVPRGLKVLVLDEADQMLSMGFAEEINAILDRLPKLRQTMLFSATIPESIQRLALRHMRSPQILSLSGDQVAAEAIRHFFYLIPATRSRDESLLQILALENPESAIVFCNTRDDTQRVASVLQREGLSADWLNADLSQAEREAVLEKTRGEHLRFLVATDVAARGIDISHLTHVVNFGFPDSAEAYVHRTGRTGRMGRTGTAISLIGPQDVGNLYYLRLQYKIDPIERHLPTAEEGRTAEELRRYEDLVLRFPDEPPEGMRSLVRRILTTLDGERLLAAALSSVVEDDAPARALAPARSARVDSPVASGPDSVPAPEEADSGRRPRRRRGRGPEASGGAEPPTLSDEPEFWERYRPPGMEEQPRGSAEAQEEGQVDETGSAPESAEGAAPGQATLYLNVGRRDGLERAGVERLLVEAGIAADSIIDIRVLDRHTFVDLPDAEITAAIEHLSGQTIGDRKLVADRARERPRRGSG